MPGSATASHTSTSDGIAGNSKGKEKVKHISKSLAERLLVLEVERKQEVARMQMEAEEAQRKAIREKRKSQAPNAGK